MAQQEFLRALGKVVIQGAKQVGTRAAAHGMKSVFKDGERLANGVRKKLTAAIDRLEEMTVVDDDAEQDDDRHF
jgi:hypothetical protein